MSNNLLIAGNKISTQTGIGTSIAIAGVAIYSFIKAKMEEEKRVSLIPVLYPLIYIYYFNFLYDHISRNFTGLLLPSRKTIWLTNICFSSTTPRSTFKTTGD